MPRNKPYVPPGGVAGANQQVGPVMRTMQTGRSTRAGGGRVNGGKRRPAGRRIRAAAAPRKRAKRVKTRRSNGRAARLVKGSAAAKRYMAKIRRMRKK